MTTKADVKRCTTLLMLPKLQQVRMDEPVSRGQKNLFIHRLLIYKYLVVLYLYISAVLRRGAQKTAIAR